MKIILSRQVLSTFFNLMLPCVLFFGCANTTDAYRSKSQTDPQCAIYANHNFESENQGKIDSGGESQVLGDAALCYEERHALNLGASQDQIRFQMNFLEFDDNGSVLDARQWNAIEGMLKHGNSPKYVIVFVHGWRHDARQDDSNVASFRKILAYSARHLHGRTEKYGNEAMVYGIYIGWPGNAWRYKWLDDLQVPAFLTYWDEKKKSEAVSKGVSEKIYQISNLVHEPDQRFDKLGTNEQSKLLVVGHSFGGNLLITGLQGQFIEALKNSKKNELIRGPADLSLPPKNVSLAEGFKIQSRREACHRTNERAIRWNTRPKRSGWCVMVRA